jgi:hypothetical protein
MNIISQWQAYGASPFKLQAKEQLELEGPLALLGPAPSLPAQKPHSAGVGPPYSVMMLLRTPSPSIAAAVAILDFVPPAQQQAVREDAAVPAGGALTGCLVPAGQSHQQQSQRPRQQGQQQDAEEAAAARGEGGSERCGWVCAISGRAGLKR